MTTTQIHTVAALTRLGLSASDILTLRRAAAALHRWAEAECNGEIERDDDTGKPVRVLPNCGICQARHAWPIADREAGALRRVKAVMDTHPDLVAFHQGDPRGCALYIIRKADVPAGANVSQYYTRGVAVNL